MVNRQLFTMKFESSRLKKAKYNIENLSFEQAKKNQEIIALGENQFLRTVNKVVYEQDPSKQYRIMDRALLETYYEGIEELKKKKENKSETLKSLAEYKELIKKMCFVPEYITVVINHDTHYEYMFNNGFTVNGNVYKRLSVSAGQGRVRTVVFCDEFIIDRVNEILDNGRDKTIPFSPSKFSAYKGLYGSATKVVKEPRFCVVKDFESPSTFTCNWITETPYEQDDKIEIKDITRQYNRFDGMGLITPSFAKQWAEDLGLEYVPAQFCIRQSFLKGMVAVFDISEFCKTENEGNYIIETMYGTVDLRNIDVIITESQFKLHQSFKSLNDYIESCRKNGLMWGVSLYTEEKIKHTLKMNYQFLGAMDIQKEDIPELCEDFVEWIKGVNQDDIWSTLLFLIGTDMTEEDIKSYLSNGENWWIKALVLNRDLLNDRYIKQKVYRLIKVKIENGFIGNIFLEGNNQTLVSDPYALMEHVCGKEVKGLLDTNEYFSSYWNNKSINEIIGMRPPLTYRAEVLKMKLVSDTKKSEWYKHCYGGIIVNVHGSETDFWAGSDFDMDFLSTTSNKVVRNSIFKNEYPICYEAPKANPIIFTDEDLYHCDRFIFGSIIGSITNKGTSGHALLPYIEGKYGLDSEIYKTLLNRVKMTCKLQSSQIDKGKIGRNVKEIPKIWTDRRYIHDNYDGDEKDMLLEIMLDRHPYFFIHLYHDTKASYNEYVNNQDISCKHKFGLSVKDLFDKEGKTDDEIHYLKNFEKYMPVIMNDSVMNNICRYLESVDYGVKKYIQQKDCKDIHLILMRNADIFNQELYDSVLEEYRKMVKNISEIRSMDGANGKRKFNAKAHNSTKLIYEKFKEVMEKVCPNTSELTDCLIRIFYVEFPSSNKELLWNIYGNHIVKNLKDKLEQPVLFPIQDDGGDIQYMNKKYSLKEIKI